MRCDRDRGGPSLALASLAGLLLLLIVAVPARAQIALPLGGVLAERADLLARWCWSGSWRFPVGDARDFSAPGADGEAAYRLNRGIGGPETGTELHQGADLACGRGGGPVRAAASGMVLVADRTGWNSGYGRIVVLGHRLADGTSAYSVYAHLSEGSIRVRAGDVVGAGMVLGRVGQSGRATTPHLHFEVRIPDDPRERWENARVVDPIAFVIARLAPAPAADSLARYREWAQQAALHDGEPGEEGSLRLGAWWRMLGAAARHELWELPGDPEALRDSLVAVGVLPEDLRDDPRDRLDRKEFARDLERLRELGVRLPPRPLPTPAHRRLCRERLEVDSPGRHPGDIAGGAGALDFECAVLALADLAPELPVAKKHAARKRVKKAARKS